MGLKDKKRDELYEMEQLIRRKYDEATIWIPSGGITNISTNKKHPRYRLACKSRTIKGFATKQDCERFINEMDLLIRAMEEEDETSQGTTGRA